MPYLHRAHLPRDRTYQDPGSAGFFRPSHSALVPGWNFRSGNDRHFAPPFSKMDRGRRFIAWFFYAGNFSGVDLGGTTKRAQIILFGSASDSGMHTCRMHRWNRITGFCLPLCTCFFLKPHACASIWNRIICTFWKCHFAHRRIRANSPRAL